MDIVIRKATIEDLDKLSELELLCFPKAEAATRDAFKARLCVYAEHFLIAEAGDDVIGMVNGLVTDNRDLTDDMYSDTDYHDKDGDWQMIFGVETHPDHQGKGIASSLLERFIDDARSDKRKGLVLTCKEQLIGFYERFGFVDEGLSESEHGGVTWHQMRLTFDR